jgi:hypothetical protein
MISPEMAGEESVPAGGNEACLIVETPQSPLPMEAEPKHFRSCGAWRNQ